MDPDQRTSVLIPGLTLTVFSNAVLELRFRFRTTKFSPLHPASEFTNWLKMLYLRDPVAYVLFQETLFMGSARLRNSLGKCWREWDSYFHWRSWVILLRRSREMDMMSSSGTKVKWNLQGRCNVLSHAFHVPLGLAPLLIPWIIRSHDGNCALVCDSWKHMSVM